jgi:uracil-DNA glycosylase
MSTSTAIKAQDIQGDLLIAFGESATHYFSGERAPVDELREILFEAVNSRSVEIPVIVTHDPEACLSQAHFKKEVWQDILMARTTYLETQ